jgi:FKBP-type peptidyl-prolyl cis-trans isomerase
MKRKLTLAVTLLAAGIGLATSVWAQQAPAAKPVQAPSSTATAPAPTPASPAASEFKTEKETASYALGMNIGDSISKSLKRDGIDIDPAIFLRGLKEALAGEKQALTEEEAKTAFTAYQKKAREVQEAKLKIVAEANKKESEAFLAANKSNEGVVTLPSGLQYKIEKQGDGPKPLSTDTVEVNYRGTLIDGNEFDSSYKRGQTATFPVTRVIKGWTEILQLMPVGSKYKIFVPADLAYGPRPAGPDIGPESALIFDIELVSIKPKPEPAATKPAPSLNAPAKPATAPDAAKPTVPAK